MTLSRRIKREYKRSRKTLYKKNLCNAPFANMYFNIHGDAAPCWLGFINPDSYPKKSIKEIWEGKRFNEFRKNIKKLTLEDTCGTCLENLNNHNFVSVLAKAYDHLGKPAKYPKMMELELDNTCNLECIMCNGFLSSAIRKNRDKKSKLEIPYDDEFVNQLNEFLPHLQELRLNGGEPFLSKICKNILDNAVKLNPKLKIVIATNGTVLNNSIKELLEKGNFNINISIDSLQKETYETIRVNAVFEEVMENFQYFLDYCRKKKTKLCVLTNPMKQNWEEMGDFVRFCNKHNIPLWFNTIRQPQEHSLWALPTEKLQEIYNTLSKESFTPTLSSPESFHNVKIFNNLVNTQIYNWFQESKNRIEKPEKANSDEDSPFLEQLKDLIKKDSKSEQEYDEKFKLINDKLETVLAHLKEKQMSENDFYSFAANLPIKMVYSELLSKSSDELISLIDKYGN
jgi:molybdenum cofactor biosynthesis enzyme MoaA